MKSSLATENDTRPKFWKWLRGLKNECRLQEANIIRLNAGTPVKRKREDVLENTRRKRICEGYNPDDKLEYLQRHADVMNFVQL